MEYVKYQHIEKLGSSEVDGILNGEVHLSYKIDGTNGCVYLKDDGTLGYGSRRRPLTPEDDNQGFATGIEADEATKAGLLGYLTRHPDRIVYGEWLVPVSLKTYAADAWKHFYVFDVFVPSTGEYIPYTDYSKELAEWPAIKVIPEIAVLLNPAESDIEAWLRKTGDWLVTSGLGEGIVIKNYGYVNRYGRRTWAKMLTEDFRKNRKSLHILNAVAKEEGTVEHLIISSMLTPEHVLKEKAKMEESAPWSNKRIPELFNRVFLEFFRDNWEKILKKYHDPVIDFKRLRKESMAFIKSVIGIKEAGK